MSDSIKSVIKYYISVQIFSFWVSFLEVWEIFDFFVPTVPKGARKRVSYHLFSFAF